MKKTIRHLAGAACLVLASSSFAASLSVAREITVDHSPATVWKLLGDFNALDVWLPGIRYSSSRGDGTRPGAIRLLQLADQQSITEELRSYDASKRSYSYAILKSPLPIRNYVSTIELSDAANGRTSIRWSSTFEASGAPDEKAKETILSIYDAGLARLAAGFKE